MTFTLQPTMLAIVLVLVELLGHDDFGTREAASAALRDLDAPAVLIRGLRHRDGEVRRRSLFLLEDVCSVLPTTYPQTPWIDMLPPCYPDRDRVQAEYLNRARHEETLAGHPEWFDYRHACDLMVVDLRLTGLSRQRVRVLLDEMSANEIIYRKKHGMSELTER